MTDDPKSGLPDRVGATEPSVSKTTIEASSVRLTRLDEHGNPIASETATFPGSFEVTGSTAGRGSSITVIGEGFAETAEPEAPKAPLINGVFKDMIVACLVFELLDDPGLRPDTWEDSTLRIGRVLLVRPKPESEAAGGPSGPDLQPLYAVIPTKPSKASEDELALAATAPQVASSTLVRCFGSYVPELSWQTFLTTYTAGRVGKDSDGKAIWTGPRYAVKWVRTFVSTELFDSIGHEKESDEWDTWKLEAREVVAGRWNDPFGEEGTFGTIEPELLWVLPMAMWSHTFYSEFTGSEMRYDNLPSWAKVAGMGEANFNSAGRPGNQIDRGPIVGEVTVTPPPKSYSSGGVV